MIAALVRVAERGALLGAPMHLAEEAVDIDRQPSGARSGAGLPGARERLGEQSVELAHVAERERAQKRPQRRGRRDPAAQQPARAPGAQRVAVVDAVAPSTIAKTSDMALRPALPAPGRLVRSRTGRCASASTTSARRASAASISPASKTTRSSSNLTRTPSSPTGPSSCTIKVTS